jgi:hypothetical protein
MVGAQDSVTIRDWFTSASKRIEGLRFADGTAWDIDDIEARAFGQTDCLSSSAHPREDRNDHRQESDRAKDERGHPEQKGGGKDSVGLGSDEAVLDAAQFDSDHAVERRSKQEQAIAEQWRRVASHAETLAIESHPNDHGSASPASYLPLIDAPVHAIGFGFDASIGGGKASKDLKGFQGLSEGFRRL